MKPTDLLMTEHRVIEQVLACLGRMADRAASDGTLDVDAARKAVDFFRNFGDRCHHGKEEKHLFPLMETRGFAHDEGPIGRMLYEHAVGRRYLDAIAANVEAAAKGDAAAAGRFVDNAGAYAYWLREHILKEDNVLFPMADRALAPEDQRQLLQAFEHTEAHETSAGAHEKYLRLAAELADRFQVPRIQAPAACGCSCHP